MAKKDLRNISLATQAIERPQAALDDLVPAPNISGKRRAITYISVTDIIPDQYQSRPLLPPAVGKRFFNFEIDCFEAMRQWIQAAKVDPVYRKKLEGLSGLEESLDKQGQINAIFGYWKQAQNGRDYFFIESGERRFWSTVLGAVRRKETGENVRVACIVVPEFSLERQVAENEKSEGLSAVGKAREVARLILEYKGIKPDPSEDGYGFSYHRKAIGLRASEDVWQKIGALVNIESRSQLSKYIKILSLDDELLIAADAYNVSFKALYHIVNNVPRENQMTVLMDEINYMFQRSGQADSEDDDKYEPAADGNRNAANAPFVNTQTPALSAADTNKPTNRSPRKPVRQVPFHTKAARRFKNTYAVILKERRKDRDFISKIATETVNELDDIEQMRDFVSTLKEYINQVEMRIASLTNDYP